MKKIEFKLSPEEIRNCTNIVSELPDEYFVDSKARVSLGILLETILDQYRMELYGSKASISTDDLPDCCLSIEKNKRGANLTLRIPGKSFDPLDSDYKEDEFYSAITRNIRKNLLNEPLYSYERGTNIISLEQKKKRRTTVLFRELVVLAASALFTIIGMLLSESFRNALLPSIDIISSTIINIVKVSASFTMFLMIIEGIRSCRNLSNIKSYGKSILDLAGIKFLVGFVIIIAYIIFSGLTVRSDLGMKGEDFITTIFNTLAGIFPTSIVEPFDTINFLHIIVLGATVGLAMLVAGNRAKTLGKVCGEAQYVSGRIMYWCSGFLPIYVFCQIPSFVWGGKQAYFLQAVSLLLTILVIYLIMWGLYIAWTCKVMKISAADLIRKSFPAFYRGFMTRSSAVSFSDVQETIESFGVEKRFSDFASPISFVFCRSYHFVTIFILVVFLCTACSVEISVGLLIQIIFSSLLISIASPPFAGGTIISVSILAATFGVDESYVALATPIVLITNYVISGLRSHDIAIHTVLSACKCGKIKEPDHPAR